MGPNLSFARHLESYRPGKTIDSGSLLSEYLRGLSLTDVWARLIFFRGVVYGSDKCCHFGENNSASRACTHLFLGLLLLLRKKWYIFPHVFGYTYI